MSTLRQEEGHWTGVFRAMASPCEVLMEVDDRRDAEHILSIVSSEALRVEHKFSRYLPDNIVHRINSSQGRPVVVDEETARLLDFARTLYELSEGRFDVTSGILRRIWTFDGGSTIPDQENILEVLRYVGWNRVAWDGRAIRLEPGMQIDLGGIGKEYAVDRAALIVDDRTSCLINFGGDIVVTRARRDGQPWRVGIERPSPDSRDRVRVIRLSEGGLATSGDTHRFVMKDGVRLSHILDPRTGWPVADAPRSVTVAAGSCVQAGMVATLAMLHGTGAEDFLAAQGHRHWVAR